MADHVDILPAHLKLLPSHLGWVGLGWVDAFMNCNYACLHNMYFLMLRRTS